MCLGLLGLVVGIEERDGQRTALVDVDGARYEACLAVLPDVRVGEHVMLHLGFAITRVPPEHAEAVRADLSGLTDAVASAVDGARVERAGGARVERAGGTREERADGARVERG